MNTEKKIVAVKSPLSSLPPMKVRDLPREFLLEQLEAYYAKKPLAEVVETDYELWRCAETGLEFTWPALGGNELFYKWVSSFSSYYPGIRWEYGQVRRLLGTGPLMGEGNFKILDVGSGKGDFLRGLDSLPPDRRYALDLNEPAVTACRHQGFQACYGTIETALESGFVKPAQFPAVTSFHCLEHVENPVEFVRSLAHITASGGKIFLSTPYSPMSFEADWFDILNHPPHHLTRWNLKAYQKLGELLGLKMRSFTPPSSALQRTLNVFRLLRYGPERPVGKGKLLLDLLCHLPSVARLYGRQRRREQENGGVAADAILVEFTVP